MSTPAEVSGQTAVQSNIGRDSSLIKIVTSLICASSFIGFVAYMFWTIDANVRDNTRVLLPGEVSSFIEAHTGEVKECVQTRLSEITQRRTIMFMDTKGMADDCKAHIKSKEQVRAQQAAIGVK